jgi:phage virion morphogenesis protein
MTGVTIKVTVRDAEVKAALGRLAAADGKLIPMALKNIGELLIKSTRERFDQERAPDGKRWAPLDPEYAKGKRSKKILQESGMQGGLLGTIVYRVMGRLLEIGTNKVYGAIHQFGGVIVPRSADRLVFRIGGRLVFARKVTIPARPFLGISAADREAIVALVEGLITRDWR